MSLQVWLPFNGDFNSQGLKQVKIINNGTTFDANGKIGQCCNIANGQYLGFDAANQNNHKYPYISIACWVYPTQSDSTERHIICCYENGGCGINLKNTKLGGQVYVGGYKSCYTPTTIALNTWHHICITYNGSKLCLYLNGQLVSSLAVSGPITYHNTCPWQIAGNPGATAFGSNNFIGKINDFRMYDHALSAKEVEEISKGLVLHYLLNNSYYDNASSIPANKYTNIDQQKGYLTSTTWTRTKLSGEDGYNYKLTRTGNGSGNWPNGGLGTFTFTAGKTYWYSCKIRCNTWSSGELRLRAARISNDYHPGLKSVVVCNNQLADGQWHEYYVSQVLSATFNKSDGSSLTTAPRLEFYSSDQNENGVVYTMNFDLKELRVIESDTYYSLDLIQLKNIIYDSSGFNNNGYVVGNLGSTTPTPKYKLSTYFSKAPYIKNSNFIFNSNQWTVSFWYYKPTDLSAYEGFFCLSKNDGTDANKKIAAMPNSGRIWYKGESGSLSIAKLNIATWTFLTMVCNGTVVTIYQDGTSIGTFNASTAMTGCYDLVLGGRSSSAGVNSITCPYEGNLCDFRIYTTALAEAQIKELYNTSMKVNGTNIIPRDLE